VFKSHLERTSADQSFWGRRTAKLVDWSVRKTKRLKC